MTLTETQAFAFLALCWLVTVILAFIVGKPSNSGKPQSLVYLLIMVAIVIVAVVIVRDTWYVDTI